MSDADATVLNQYLLRSLQECMSSKGFDVVLPAQRLSNSVYSLQSRYGAIASDDPSTWGYRDPAAAEARASAQIPLTPAESDALYGSSMVDESVEAASDAPCFPLAMQQVYGNPGGLSGLSGYNELVDLQLASNDALYADPDGVVVVTAWSKCMKEQGFVYANWWDAPARFSVSDPTTTEGITVEEQKSATSDANCRDRVHLESTLLAIESRLQSAQLEEHSSVVEGFIAEEAALVAKASS